MMYIPARRLDSARRGCSKRLDQEDVITLEGTVVTALPNTTFTVEPGGEVGAPQDNWEYSYPGSWSIIPAVDAAPATPFIIGEPAGVVPVPHPASADSTPVATMTSGTHRRVALGNNMRSVHQAGP